MLICAFPPHYQSVYINFDISSFSLISYEGIMTTFHWKRKDFMTIFYPLQPLFVTKKEKEAETNEDTKN